MFLCLLRLEIARTGIAIAIIKLWLHLCTNCHLLPGEWDTDIVREARIRKGKTLSDRNLPGRGDSDGWFVRHTERALRPKVGQGPDEADGNPVHLLRHPHSKRGAAG